MKKLLKSSLILIIAVFISMNLCSNSILGESGTKIPEKGFTKVAVSFGNMLALHKDGHLWETPIFQTENAVMISGKVAEIDADDDNFYMIKKDRTLWTWSSRDNLNVKSGLKMKKPVKLLDSVKLYSSGFILRNDNSIFTWVNGKLKKVFSNAKRIVGSGDSFIIIADLKGKLYRLEVNQDTGKINTAKIAGSAKDYGPPNNEKDNICSGGCIAASFFIKKDGSLWAFNIFDDNIPDEIAGSGFNPVKIMDGVKYADCCYECIVAVKKDGSICAWGGISPLNHYSIPRNVMDHAKMICNDYYNGLVLCTDNSLWYNDCSLERSVNTKILSDVDRVEDNGPMKPATIIKKDGTRWYLALDSNDTPKAVKYPDGTIKVVEDILIMKDGSLMQEEYNQDKGIKEFKKFGSGIKDVSEFYSSEYLHNVYILKKDRTLWILSKNSDEPKGLQKPLKLADAIIQVYRYDSWIFALNNKGELLTWDIKEDKFSKDQLKSKMILSGIESLNPDDYELFITKNDKTIWAFDTYGADTKNPQSIHDSFVKFADNSDDIRYFNSHGLLYNDGRLFVYQDNDFKKPVIKVMDNVKEFISDGSKYLAISKDNSLWEFGCFCDEKKSKKDLKPKKVLDNIKECRIYNEIAIALSYNGNLYTWGDNSDGELGYEELAFRQTPKKVMEGISYFNTNTIGNRVYAISNKGNLYQWGAGFFICHEQPYTRTPLNINTYSKTPLIRHQSYAAVRVGEILDILVKITQPDYQHNVNVILSNGTKVKMKPCAAGYYEAQVISRSKNAGHISYKIQASNLKGVKAETEFYNVQVIGNTSRRK